MELFLILNGFEIDATAEEQYEIIMKISAGKIKRDSFSTWLGKHIKAIQ